MLTDAGVRLGQLQCVCTAPSSACAQRQKAMWTVHISSSAQPVRRKERSIWVTSDAVVSWKALAVDQGWQAR